MGTNYNELNRSPDEDVEMYTYYPNWRTNHPYYINLRKQKMEQQKQLISLISNELGISKAFLADKAGLSRQMFNHSVNNGKLSSRQIRKVLEAARVDLVDGYAIINDIKVKLDL